MDIIHIFPMGVFSQERRGANDDVDTVDTGLNGNPGIVHVTADVSEDFRFETEFANSFAIGSGLLRGSG